MIATTTDSLLPQARLSQPKDETWSDCAEQGFAGMVDTCQGRQKICYKLQCIRYEQLQQRSFLAVFMRFLE